MSTELIIGIAAIVTSLLTVVGVALWIHNGVKRFDTKFKDSKHGSD